ncbi:hypothetical protein I7V34_05025 [Bacillus sp. V3]|nr:hypothetical protein I7V34_05025 [Bacillus sp. V3]
MFGSVEVIPLNIKVSNEDVLSASHTSSRLKAGKVIKISFLLNKHSSAITYDIDGGSKTYVNVEDCASLTSIERQCLFYDTMFDLEDDVQIEIAGLKRNAEVVSIEINWNGGQYIVSYGARDRTETVYYGIPEKTLKKWNTVNS